MTHVAGPLQVLHSRIQAVQPSLFDAQGGPRSQAVALLDTAGGEDDTGRLLVLAYNSYDRQFGVNAGRAAEMDALGIVISLLREVLDRSPPAALPAPVIERARSVLLLLVRDDRPIGEEGGV